VKADFVIVLMLMLMLMLMLVLVLVLVLVIVIDPVSITIMIRSMIMSTKKSPDRFRAPGFSKFYPADAVKADIPFPFGNGRTTAARASDFQLRHVIFPVQPSLLKLMKYRFGNHTCNLEHRRANG
jgi:hypothetical protein